MASFDSSFISLAKCATDSPLHIHAWKDDQGHWYSLRWECEHPRIAVRALVMEEVVSAFEQAPPNDRALMMQRLYVYFSDQFVAEKLLRHAASPMDEEWTIILPMLSGEIFDESHYDEMEVWKKIGRVIEVLTESEPRENSLVMENVR